jgi:ATP-binding cassette subfamily B protein
MANPAASPDGRNTAGTAQRVQWRTRVAALKNVRPLMRMAWRAAPGQMSLSLGLRVVTAILPLSMLYVSKLIVDHVVTAIAHGQTDWHAIWWLLAAELGLAALTDILARLIDLSDGLLSVRFGNAVNLRLMEHTCSLDLASLEDPGSLDRLERARTQAVTRLELLAAIGRIVQSSVTLLSYSAGVLWFSPLLFAMLLGSVVPAFIGETHFAALGFMMLLRQTPHRRELDYLRFLGASHESAKEIKVFGLDGFVLARYRELADRFYREHRELGIRRAAVGAALSITGTIGYYGAYAVVLYRTLLGELSLGDMTFLAGTFLRSRTSIQTIFASLTGVAEQTLLLTNLFDFLAMRPRIVSTPDARPAPRPIRRGFEFQDVSFRYDSSAAFALRNVSFTLAPGERLALVGENGAGKTTLVKLLARLYDPTEGRILLDGVDLREYDLEDLRREIGVIFQDYVRFQMRAYENIGLGSIEHIGDHARVEWAAAQSRASDIVARLPGQYGQMLGRRFEGGVDLSGGEWQKFALSRAYMRDPQLLILDEPTASLDARGEYEVFRSFMDLSRARMTVLISHRFSTARAADRILVLEHGAIREEGTHQQLLGLAGRYAELFDLQAGGYRA